MSRPFPNSLFNLSVNGGSTPGRFSVVKLTGLWDGNNKGSTFNQSQVISYAAYNSLGEKFLGTYTTSWIVGQNNFSFNENVTGESLPVSGILFVADTLTVSNVSDEWFYNVNNIKTTAVISGGAWSEALSIDIPISYVKASLQKDYIGSRLPDAGLYGDYSLSASVTAIDGVVTQASNNEETTSRWTPKLFIVGYRIDGVNWVNNVEPIPEVTGVETIDLAFVKGADYLLDENGEPVYDENGFIGYEGGTGEVELAATLPIGINGLTVLNIADSSGEEKATEGFEIERTPVLKWVALTSVSYEEFGIDEFGNSSYPAVNALMIDQGLVSQQTVTPIEAPYPFALPYETKEVNASYGYPGEQVKTIQQNIDYTELAFQALDDQDQFYMVNDYPSTENLDDVTEFYMINGEV